jgi:hypothetical protein
MLDRIWWFLSGLAAGAWVTARALRRTPTPGDLRSAAVASGADLLDLTARLLRPRRR